MAIKKILALLVALSVCACALINTTPKEMVIDILDTGEEKEGPNVLGGVKNITDWFALMPSVADFDVDKSNSIDQMEYYLYVKFIRSQFQWASNWTEEADEDKSGYVTTAEWAKQVAKVRVNEDWVKVFDTDRDGKMSVDEEIVASKHINDIEEYYRTVVTTTATTWPRTIDVDVMKDKYDADGSWSIDDAELTKYLNDTATTFMFYYDWNGNGMLDPIERATASDVIKGTFKEINEYLSALKAQKYSEFL